MKKNFHGMPAGSEAVSGIRTQQAVGLVYEVNKKKAYIDSTCEAYKRGEFNLNISLSITLFLYRIHFENTHL